MWGHFGQKGFGLRSVGMVFGVFQLTDEGWVWHFAEFGHRHRVGKQGGFDGSGFRVPLHLIEEQKLKTQAFGKLATQLILHVVDIFWVLCQRREVRERRIKKMVVVPISVGEYECECDVLNKQNSCISALSPSIKLQFFNFSLKNCIATDGLRSFKLIFRLVKTSYSLSSVN